MAVAATQAKSNLDPFIRACVSVFCVCACFCAQVRAYSLHLSLSSLPHSLPFSLSLLLFLGPVSFSFSFSFSLLSLSPPLSLLLDSTGLNSPQQLYNNCQKQTHFSKCAISKTQVIVEVRRAASKVATQVMSLSLFVSVSSNQIGRVQSSSCVCVCVCARAYDMRCVSIFTPVCVCVCM